jgi:hypothetical protein
MIANGYRKVNRFQECFAKLEHLYLQEYDLIANLCYNQLLFWMQELNLHTPIVRVSELPGIEGKKSDFVLNLCLQVGATHFISGAKGRDYLDTEKFAARGIKVEFQEFVCPIYPQLHGEFVPNLSIVDYWFNVGT